jgi:fructose-bisphosphate aldolase, class I
MPIRFQQESDTSVLVVHVTGLLVEADYKYFVTELERQIGKHGKLRLLFDMTDFDGWDPRAAWDDFKLGVAHFSAIERMAMVGETKWQQGMALFCKPFSYATVRYFNHGAGTEAFQWLEESPRVRLASGKLDERALVHTASALLFGYKGILAMDESTPTCHKRFGKLGIPQTVEARRSYREMIITAPGLSESISGAILFDETIRQCTKGGMPFVDVLVDAGIIPGIKVDLGAKDLAGRPGEKVTEGLDGLRERLAEYAGMGARFAKWRAVLAIGDGLPSLGCMEANAHALARYASLCQEAGLVPIVEPEVLMEGAHGLERCSEVTEEVLRTLFVQLHSQRVMLEGMILKSNMVLPGSACLEQETVEDVAEATLKCLQRAVPTAVPGIAFLSGGQSAELASARLNAMNMNLRWRGPWDLSFSFARAIQQPALEIWKGQDSNVPEAQAALVHRAECNRAARRGGYTAAMETPAASHESERNAG